MEHVRGTIQRSRNAFLVVLAILTYAVVQNSWHRVEETRFYRDLVGSTPFQDVEIDRTEVSDDGQTLRVWGSFRKSRCDKFDHAAYTRKIDGHRWLARFSTEEGPLQKYSRPAGRFSETFGPWVITSMIKDPDYALFVPYHSCPEGVQTNLFFEVPWRNYDRKAP